LQRLGDVVLRLWMKAQVLHQRRKSFARTSCQGIV
jgi:hypothetical protein